MGIQELTQIIRQQFPVPKYDPHKSDLVILPELLTKIVMDKFSLTYQNSTDLL